MNNYYNTVDDFETIKLNLSNIIAFNYKINRIASAWLESTYFQF